MATLTGTRGSGLDFLDEEVRGSDAEAVPSLVDLGDGRSGCALTSMEQRLFAVSGEEGTGRSERRRMREEEQLGLG
jgi:hypothetical protein